MKSITTNVNTQNCGCQQKLLIFRVNLLSTSIRKIPNHTCIFKFKKHSLCAHFMLLFFYDFVDLPIKLLTN